MAGGGFAEAGGKIFQVLNFMKPFFCGILFQGRGLALVIFFKYSLDVVQCFLIIFRPIKKEAVSGGTWHAKKIAAVTNGRCKLTV